eukprot:80479-Amphidinium_carterae.1
MCSGVAVPILKLRGNILRTPLLFWLWCLEFTSFAGRLFLIDNAATLSLEGSKTCQPDQARLRMRLLSETVHGQTRIEEVFAELNQLGCGQWDIKLK